MEKLNKNCLSVIFSFLELNDLSNVFRVCKNFNKVASSDLVSFESTFFVGKRRGL